MDLIIKCSSDWWVLGGSAPVQSWGFSVRRHHRVVHQASGLLAADGRPTVASLEAVRRALAWLREQTVHPGPVLIRSPLFFEAGLPLADLLLPLYAAGWEVELQPVTSEYVSEATALAWSAAGDVPKAAVGKKGCPVVLGSHAVVHAWDSTAESDLTLVCDGGYRPMHGRDGLAVYGFLVWEHFRLLHQDSGVVCSGPAASSQVAELAAAVSALRWLSVNALGVAQVELRSDCSWLADILTGRPIRAPYGSVMLLREAERLLDKVQRRGCRVAVWRVPRPMVAEADRLCREEYVRHANPGRLPVSAFLQG